MCNALSRLKLNELFTLDNNRGTRGHSWKLVHGTAVFFSKRVINR